MKLPGQLVKEEVFFLSISPQLFWTCFQSLLKGKEDVVPPNLTFLHNRLSDLYITNNQRDDESQDAFEKLFEGLIVESTLPLETQMIMNKNRVFKLWRLGRTGFPMEYYTNGFLNSTLVLGLLPYKFMELDKLQYTRRIIKCNEDLPLYATMRIELAEKTIANCIVALRFFDTPKGWIRDVCPEFVAFIAHLGNLTLLRCIELFIRRWRQMKPGECLEEFTILRPGFKYISYTPFSSELIRVRNLSSFASPLVAAIVSLEEDVAKYIVESVQAHTNDDFASRTTSAVQQTLRIKREIPTSEWSMKCFKICENLFPN